MAKRLHNIIFSVLCTHQHTQSCLQIEKQPTCSHHALSPPAHLDTLSMCRPTVQTQTYTSTLSGDNPLLLTAGWTRNALRHRQNQRERSVEPVMCVLDLYPDPQCLLTLLISPDVSCTFSSLSTPFWLLRVCRQTSYFLILLFNT